MENFNIHNPNSNCGSDTESEIEDNKVLFDFIFDKSKSENKQELSNGKMALETNIKSGNKAQ